MVLDLFSLFCVRKRNLPNTVLYNEPNVCDNGQTLENQRLSKAPGQIYKHIFPLKKSFDSFLLFWKQIGQFKLCFDCLKGFFPLLFASLGHSLSRLLFCSFCSLPVQTPIGNSLSQSETITTIKTKVFFN